MELARRQDELLKRQQDLARQREQMTEEELKRELEKLTRDQSELRQKAEELAQKMQKAGQEGNKAEGQKGQEGQQGQQGQQGQHGRKVRREGRAIRTDRTAGAVRAERQRRMRDVSEEMRNAASCGVRIRVRRAHAVTARAREAARVAAAASSRRVLTTAAARWARCSSRLRQLPDAQKQIASELAAKTAQGDAGKDAVSRLAGEQRLAAPADRRNTHKDSLKRQATSRRVRTARQGAQRMRQEGSTPLARPAWRREAAAGDVAKDIRRRRLSERMRQAADAMRATTKDRRGGRGNFFLPRQRIDRRSASAGEIIVATGELARALEKAAARLASATGSQDGDSQKLSEQRARAQRVARAGWATPAARSRRWRRRARGRRERQEGQDGQEGAREAQDRAARALEIAR